MRKALLGLSALALASALAACGPGEPENNVAVEDVNAMMNLDELPPGENVANEAVEAPATETPPAAQPAPAKPAPAKPKPKPAEPKAPASECLPEHRAAGHC
jgi:outer membrane biosynthesis protein TonB